MQEYETIFQNFTANAQVLKYMVFTIRHVHNQSSLFIKFAVIK